MDRSEIPEDKPQEARCYYVEHQRSWWGFFTIVPAIGLLQIHSDFGTFSHRWSQPGPDFRQFLLGTSDTYVSGKLRSWALSTFSPTSRKGGELLETKIHNLMTFLWPLFIDHLKAEMEAEQTTCKP